MIKGLLLSATGSLGIAPPVYKDVCRSPFSWGAVVRCITSILIFIFNEGSKREMDETGRHTV